MYKRQTNVESAVYLLVKAREEPSVAVSAFSMARDSLYSLCASRPCKIQTVENVQRIRGGNIYNLSTMQDGNSKEESAGEYTNGGVETTCIIHT